MQEYNYASEPMDLKLLAILFVKHIWIPIIAALLGAAIGGIGYFVGDVLLAPQPEYAAYSELYVDFAANENGAYTYYSFNEAGWNGLVKTDVILEEAIKYLDFPISKEELRDSVSANNRSDHRMIQLTVTYQEPQKAVKIANAMEQSLLTFGRQMRECENIRLFTSAESATRILADNFTLRAAVLGGLLFLIVTLFAMWISFILDDSVYVPITFEKRYRIPMLGVLTKEKNEKYNQELTINVKAACADQKELFLEAIDEEQDISGLCEKLGLPQTLEKQRILLAVEAGAHNGKRMEKKISDLRKEGYQIVAAVLLKADDKLLKQYYFGMRRKSER